VKTWFQAFAFHKCSLCRYSVVMEGVTVDMPGRQPLRRGPLYKFNQADTYLATA
jgi:hypothetical protein